MNNKDIGFKKTNFFINKKIKYCSKLILFALLFGFILLFNFFNTSAQADTKTSQIVPGQSFDTGNHIYPADANRDSVLWTNIGAAQTTSSLPFSVNLVNSQSKSTGYALFNGAVDMSKEVSFSGLFSLSDSSGKNSFAVGDSLGFILTPKSTDFVTDNLEKNKDNVVGKYLGIGGLSDSIFMGRDLYQNSDVDLEGTGAKNAPSDNIAIRQTDNFGALIKQGYATASVPNNSSQITENMKIEWQPTEVNTNEGTVKGLLTYTISPADGGNTTSLSETVTVARSMSLGIIGATGGNYGLLSYSSINNNFTAHKGTQDVQINYLDQETEEAIDNALPSIVTANVGDTITVFGKQLRDTVSLNTYSYLAPTISGYQLASTETLVVSNNDSEKNVINLYYKKISMGKAHFAYQYDSDVTDLSFTLPSIDDTEGELNSAVTEPLLPALPEDYFISKVVTGKGQQYKTLGDALHGVKYSDEALQFTLMISKKELVPAIKKSSSNESTSKEAIKKEQVKESSKLSTTVAIPEKQENKKEENKKQENKKEENKKEENSSTSESQPGNLPVAPLLELPTLKAKSPQSSVKVAAGVQNKQSKVSAHNLEIQVAGTAGIFAGGVVAIGTITGFNKFYKFWKIVKK